ncbi:hypothetical protein [Halomicrococcus sp. NG-SE-24]|uniref:hypothetical protein n=1 Tax=Halomicrococcus sp. NG-SE-24 TaxID=3436928 RepID=UPI003D956C01
MTEHNEELPVAEFFEEPQAIGLIALIDRENGNIKNELFEIVDLTGKPLKKLLDKAIEADLIEETTIQAGDHPRSDRYRLTERGEAIQSLLRGAGLDDLQRAYLDAKSELQSARSDIRGLIEAENLHKKYPQRDYWVQTGSEPPEIDIEQLREEAKQENEDLFETRIPGTRGDSDVEVIDDEDDALEPQETWGDPSDEKGDREE